MVAVTEGDLPGHPQSRQHEPTPGSRGDDSGYQQNSNICLVETLKARPRASRHPMMNSRLTDGSQEVR